MTKMLAMLKVVMLAAVALAAASSSPRAQIYVDCFLPSGGASSKMELTACKAEQKGDREFWADKRAPGTEEVVACTDSDAIGALENTLAGMPARHRLLAHEEFQDWLGDRGGWADALLGPLPTRPRGQERMVAEDIHQRSLEARRRAGALRQGARICSATLVTSGGTYDGFYTISVIGGQTIVELFVRAPR